MMTIKSFILWVFKTQHEHIRTCAEKITGIWTFWKVQGAFRALITHSGLGTGGPLCHRAERDGILQAGIYFLMVDVDLITDSFPARTCLTLSLWAVAGTHGTFTCEWQGSFWVPFWPFVRLLRAVSHLTHLTTIWFFVLLFCFFEMSFLDSQYLKTDSNCTSIPSQLLIFLWRTLLLNVKA